VKDRDRTTLPPEKIRRIAEDRVAVVVNGNARRVSDELVESLDQIVQSGDLFLSRSLDEGRDIARRIVERGYPTVLTGGGDGTFVQMVTWIVRESSKQGATPPRFGLLRLGTGNAVAWVLGAQNSRSRGVFADLGRLRREGGSRPLRLLNVEGTLTPFAGLGGDAVALHHFEQVKGAFQRTPLLRNFATGGVAYAVALVGRVMPEYLVRPRTTLRIVNEGQPAHLLGPDGQPVGAPIETGEVIFEGQTKLAAMSTIPYWGFGARVFPFANEREDRFNLRLIDISSLDLALNIRSIWHGTYRSPRVIDYLAHQIRVECHEPTPFQIGGDSAGKRDEVTVSLADEPIQVVDYYAPPIIDREAQR